MPRDLERAEDLVRRANKYKAYKALPIETRRQQYAERAPAGSRVEVQRTSGYVAPFSTASNDITYIKAPVLSPSPAGQGASTAQVVLAVSNDYFKYTLTSTDLFVDAFVRKRLAKVIFKRLITLATEKTKSRMTDEPYKKHSFDSVTQSIGKKVAANTFQSVKNEIENKTESRNFLTANPKNRIYFKPEG